MRYDRNGYAQLLLPGRLFSLSIFLITLTPPARCRHLYATPVTASDPAAPFYGYQLDPGGGITPAGLTPPWARPWPPQRMVPMNVSVQFRCGYGGPVKVSIAASSTALAAPGFTFNPDDAPQITGDTGTAISIPGAGPLVGGVASALVTNVASVAQGAATLKDPASTAASGAVAWLGDPIPFSLQMAIFMQAQFYFEQGAVTDQVEPRIINSLRNGGYRNLVS